MMRLVSFNINGLRARLHQLEALIGLQKTTVHDPGVACASITF